MLLYFAINSRDSYCRFVGAEKYVYVCFGLFCLGSVKQIIYSLSSCILSTFTLSGKTMSDKIFVRQNYSLGKIFVPYEKFRHFSPTKHFVHFRNFKLAQKRFNLFIFLEII